MRTLVELSRAEVATMVCREVARKNPGLVVGRLLGPPAENFFVCVENKTPRAVGKGGKRK